MGSKSYKCRNERVAGHAESFLSRCIKAVHTLPRKVLGLEPLESNLNDTIPGSGAAELKAAKMTNKLNASANHAALGCVFSESKAKKNRKKINRCHASAMKGFRSVGWTN